MDKIDLVKKPNPKLDSLRINELIGKFDYPVVRRRDEINKLISNHNQSILIGQTGSGKSTIGPLILLQHKLENDVPGKIVVTQPRQFSTSSVSQRVADIFGCKIGEEVGYKYRGVNKTSEDTVVEFQTDGLLLSEIKRDPILSSYGYIMVDEAHERSVNIDLLLGLIKRANILRKQQGITPIKVSVASATIDKDKFSKYFVEEAASLEEHQNVVEVEGRLHPVDIRYLDTNPVDYTQAASQALKKSIESGEDGDVLIFMPGKSSIEKTIESVKLMLKNESMEDSFEIFPLHAEVSLEDQKRIFLPSSKRKIIVSTNIAETSVTIDGVSIVIDSGVINQSDFDSKSGAKILTEVKHSIAGLNQRSGRAGRTKAGICYRLFSKDDLENRASHTIAEIERSELSNVLLLMKSMGINNVFPMSEENIEGFDYIDSPKKENIDSSLNLLKNLGLISSDGIITELGLEVSKLPLEPRLGKLVVEAEKFDCVSEAITVASFLSSKSIFRSGLSFEESALQNELKGESFIETYLNIFNEYCKIPHSKRFDWCRGRGINHKALEEIISSRKNIASVSPSPVKFREITPEILEAIKLTIATTYSDYLSFSEDYGSNFYLANPASVSSVFPDRNGQNPIDFFIFTGLSRATDRKGRPIAFLQNVLNLSPEVVLQAYPERIDKKSSIALNWQGKFERTVTSSISINNRDFTISSKTEVLDTLEASDWETYLRSQYSYDLSSVVDSIKSITSQVVVLNPKLKLTEGVQSLNLDNALTAFCVELSKDPEIMREMENSRYSTSSLFKSKFTDFLQKNNPDLASLLVEHKKLTEEKTISINGESSNLSFIPKIKNDSLVYEVQGNLMDIAKNYYSLLSEAGDVPLYIGDNPINSQLRDFFSTEPRSGNYSYSNSGTRLIDVFTPTSSDIGQVNSIPEDSFDFAELETGITNPFTKKKVKIYAIRMSDEYLSRRFPVGKIIDGIFYTQSLSEIQDVQSYLGEQHAVNFERIKVRKEAQKLLDVVSDESIAALIAKYRDLPGFTPEVEVKLRDMSRFSFSLQNIISSIDNGYMYGEIDMELKSKINSFLEYINFIQQNLHKTPEELQAYYLEEVNKLIEKHYSRCPIHPEVIFSENGYICNKNHKQNMSYLQSSDQPNSNVVVSRIALGLGSDFQFVPAGLYLQDWNNNAQKTRGDDFYPLIPFYFDGDLNEFERPGINMFATVEDQIINSRKRGTGTVNFKFLQLDDLDQINVFLGPITFIPPNGNGM